MYHILGSQILGFILLVVVFCVVESRPNERPTLRTRQGQAEQGYGANRIQKPEFKTHYFDQVLNHFIYTPNSYTTFRQKYLANSKYWGGAQTNSHIFVKLGGEGPIDVNADIIQQTAPVLKALLVKIEHCYYGDSLPFGSEEAAYKDANTLGQLITSQALSDYAMLIMDLKRN
ncbi:hypothetical protein GIB67_014611 [Kingdonia uniflora]|uniref:Uncharacterized protein n=1 Tax=Kingdonia uniflora TaxID=39325 RepID=A0A7J7NV04_9MAGN|nr:hypothetical protein GIB67_014611 [Kingdonia uniflora]